MQIRWGLVAILACAGCGTAASVGSTQTENDGGRGTGTGDGGTSASGSVAALPVTPAGGTVQQRAFTLRSASLRLEPDRKVLTLRDYVSDCGVVPGALPGPDALSVLVVVRLTAAGEETIAYADNHSATFQIGVQPPNVQTIAANAGRLRLDTFSTTPGDVVKGALALESGANSVTGTFEAQVCLPR